MVVSGGRAVNGWMKEETLAPDGHRHYNRTKTRGYLYIAGSNNQDSFYFYPKKNPP